VQVYCKWPVIVIIGKIRAESAESNQLKRLQGVRKMKSLPDTPSRLDSTANSRPNPKVGGRTFKSTFIFAIKLAIALGALYYVVATKVVPNESRMMRRDVVDARAGLRKLEELIASPGVLIAAILAFTVQILISAQRMRLLLKPQGIAISYWTATRMTYLGSFFDTFMLTAVGGDVVKAVYLARESPREHRVEAVSILFLDRLMGMIGLLALALIVAALEGRRFSDNPELAWLVRLLIVVPCLLLVGSAMLLSETVFASAPMQFALRVLPMGGTLARAYASLQRFRNHPRVLLHAFALSIAAHSFGILASYILVTGGHFEISKGIGAFFVGLLICNFACSFAPFAGIGVGQTIYDPLFLLIAGMKFGWVLATATQAVLLLGKAPGFIAWLLSREINAS